MLRRGLAATAGVGVLIGTWMLLFAELVSLTEGWLVPWDLTRERPPIGTMERTLNDFLEISPGNIMPATFLIAASVVLFVIRVVLSADRPRVPWVFAGLNLVYEFPGIPLAAGAHVLPYLWLPQPRPVPDIGYHLEWPSAASLLIFWILLLWAQWKFTSSRREVAATKSLSALRREP